MKFTRQLVWFSAVALGLAACSPGKESYPVAERSMTDLAADFAAGKVTSETLTNAYIARIKT